MKTDSQIQKDVLAELRYEQSINADHIGVVVNEGIVTLSGYTDSYLEKWSVEQATKRVAGVRALVIDIEVKLPGLLVQTDEDVVRNIENALAWSSNIPKDTIQVMVEKGWVTLSGAVEWYYQRRAAEMNIRHLSGVTGVSNQITIKTHATLNAVKGDILVSLHRQAAADAKRISIEVIGNQVEISGTVTDWKERSLIKQAAWNSAGVVRVIDNTTFEARGAL